MTNCLPANGLQVLGDDAVADFDRRIASIPDSLCSSFNSEASRLEAALLTIYKIAVLCVKEEEDLNKVAACWACMVVVCQGFANSLHQLAEQHPYCGADLYYDR